jgi:hypothetical protein
MLGLAEHLFSCVRTREMMLAETVQEHSEISELTRRDSS